MSTQAAQDFIDRANHDEAIRRLALERLDEIVDVGREHGYDFARDEFDEAMRERKAAQGPSGGRDDDADDDDAGRCQCTPATSMAAPR